MLGNHIKTSFQYVRRSPFQALAAISVLAVTFFVGTLIAVLIYSSNQVLRDFETRPQIIAFLKKDVTTADQETLKKALEADVRVRNVHTVSKEEAAEIYKLATSDNPLLGELVSPTIFPASIEFSVTDLSFAEELISVVKQEAIVESVGFTASLEGETTLSSVLERLKTVTRYIRIGGLVAALTLGLTSFLVLMVIISMRIQGRKSEIQTLSLIGATGGFIRIPIVFEGIIYALWGAFIGWFLALVALLYATPSILKYFETIEVLPRNPGQFFILAGGILIIELAVAGILAIGASWVTISRALK